MVRFLRQSALLVFWGFLGAMANGQESAKKDAEPAKKRVTISDDFQRDTRSQYLRQGPLKWERGKLTLEDGASFGKTVQAGARAELTLHLESPAFGRDGQRAEFWIRFGVGAPDAGATSVVIRRQRTGGTTTSDILVVNTFSAMQPGKTKPTFKNATHRELTGLTFPRPSLLTVTYRHGLVTVAADKKEVAWGYVEKGSLPVSSWVVQNLTGKLDCHHVDFTSSRPLALTPQQQKLVQEASKLTSTFTALYRSGKYQQALATAQRLVDIAKDVLGETHPHYATNLNNVAAVYDGMGQYARAERLYAQVRDIYRETLGKAHPSYATSLNNLAMFHFRNGEYGKARSLFVQVLDIHRKVLGMAHPTYALSLNNLAGLYNDMGDYAKAEALYIQSRDIRKKAVGEEHPDYAVSLNNLATLYQDMGKYAKAEALYVQSRDIEKKVLGETHPSYARSLSNLALLYKVMGDYAKAEPLNLQAVDILKKTLGEAHPLYATSLNNLATLYNDAGDYAKAEPLYVQAADIFRKALGPAHPSYATSLNNLAELYRAMDDYAKAEALYVQSRDIRRKALGEGHPDYAASLNNLALLYASMGDYTKAKPLCLELREIYKKSLGEAHPSYASGLNNLAEFYRAMGEHAKAEPLYLEASGIYKKALGEAHPSYAASLNNLAALYQDMTEYAKAERLYVQTLDLKKKVLGEQHPDYGSGLKNLALLYASKGDHGKAEPLLRRGLIIGREHLQLTFAAQSPRQQLVRATALRTTLDAYLSLAPRAKVADAGAYGHALSWKGAVFARQGGVRQLRDDSANAKLFAQLQQVSAQLAKQSFAVPTPQTRDRWLERIEELTEQKHKLEVELSRRSAEFRRGQELSRLTPAELQQALPEGTALVDFLEYTRFEPSPKSKGGFDRQRHLLAFVVPSQGEIQRIEFGPHEPIAAAIQRWRKAVEAKQFADRMTALELRRVLGTPLEKHLQAVKTILVWACGALNRFPFAALPGAKPATYLIEERAIAVVPVPQLLPQLLAAEPPEKAQKESLLLVGDVDYGQSPGKAGDLIASRSAPGGNPAEGPLWDFQMLDHTGAEIAAIGESFQRTFANGTVRRLRRGLATESAFRAGAPKHRWLHLATHGYFAPARIKSALAPAKDDSQPHSLFSRQDVTGFHPGLLSGLALTGANTPPKEGDDDGILTALEVAAIDLRGTELAVLSACHTGLGKVAAGEGVLGLQRAFQVSGARTTVTSLWQVDDLATKELMVRFYRNIWDKKLPKLEALRETQLWMIRTGHKFLKEEYQKQGRGTRDLVRVTDDQPKTDRLPPYYWAAFVLSGDWR